MTLMDESAWRSEETVDDEPNIPFGGIGVSGTGSRFGVVANLDAFTNTPYPF